jgi:hypothetical protein
MYDWMYYVALGLGLFLTAFSFTSPKAKDDQSGYTGGNPNPSVMGGRLKMPPTTLSEKEYFGNPNLPQMRNPPPAANEKTEKTTGTKSKNLIVETIFFNFIIHFLNHLL